MNPDDNQAKFRATEEETTLRRARLLGLEYVDTRQLEQKNIFPDVLSIEEMRQRKVIPLEYREGFVRFGITVTTPQPTLKELHDQMPDFQISFAMISESGFREYMEIYDPPKKVEYQDISVGGDNRDLVTKVSETIASVKADDIFAYLVQQAHRLNASDIHLESQKDHVRVRIRIDGVLHTIARLSPDKYRTLIGTIAIAGNISTSSPEAQQGHIAQTVVMADSSKVQINMRLETVPTVFGMDIVMRLFNMSSDMYMLDKLGLTDSERSVVDDIINKPTGLVLVVGPTGSGKTTTLYSMLNSLNTDERKIITLEDPVEYQFAGISQVSLATRKTTELAFADHLRAVLRLDPDIVMIGEIRDLDTAKTAMQASLTGHLVLATFHAGSAAAALTRLMDVIGENPLYLSAIRLVMAQRLIRKLDDTTKQSYQPDDATKQKIHDILATMPEGYQWPDMDNLTLFKPGSSEENPYGFSGQIALREQLQVTDALRNLLQQPASHLSTQAIEETASKAGMKTMLQNGIERVVAGETSFEEVFRVLG